MLNILFIFIFFFLLLTYLVGAPIAIVVFVENILIRAVLFIMYGAGVLTLLTSALFYLGAWLAYFFTVLAHFFK